MKTIQSIDKTMKLLNYIAEHKGTVTMTDISHALNIPMATLHGFLSTLEAWEMVSKDAAGKYRLGAKLFHLSLFCTEPQQVRTAVYPILRRLAAEFDETLHLGILMGDTLIYADRAEPEQPFRTTAAVGEAVPYHDSAIGIMIHIANNQPVPIEYLQHCNDMAQDGYCLKYEPEMDAYCLAVPFLQPGRKCIAGFSVVIPAFRYQDTLIRHIVQRIQDSCRLITL